MEAEMIPNMFKNYEDNIIEYKSSHDHYNIKDILKLVGDAFYFGYNRNLTLNYMLNNVCLWFLVVNPFPFKKWYKKNAIEKTNLPGHYFLQNNIYNIRIIVINELEHHKKENILLLLMASGEKFRLFLKYLLENERLISKLRSFLLHNLRKVIRNIENSQSFLKFSMYK